MIVRYIDGSQTAAKPGAVERLIREGLIELDYEDRHGAVYRITAKARLRGTAILDERYGFTRK